MTFGGEPLLYPEVVCAIHETATVFGIPGRSVLTNAGTPRTDARAREVASRLAESGVLSIGISVDTFHQEYIPLTVVARNVSAYVDAGIPELFWNPCWVVSADDDNPYNRLTKDILNALGHLPVEVDRGNIVEPDGNAKEWLKPYMPQKMPVPEGSCEDNPYGQPLTNIECIAIQPDGGVDICVDWIIGNAAQRDILEILACYDPYAIPEIEALITDGMAALAELFRGKGINPDPEGYYSACDMCKSLRYAGRTATR
jgi:hypothetical protein